VCLPRSQRGPLYGAGCAAAHKPALEKHLKERLGELFELDYDLLLYDVTSTYFEGQAEKNPQALRGYSRDHAGLQAGHIAWW